MPREWAGVPLPPPLRPNIIRPMRDALSQLSTGHAPQPAQVFRFAGVELRPHDSVLVVDGRPRPCSRKALELIWALCRHPRRTRSRDALIAEVWPGGQIVSDEALTQLVFRARNALGPYGELINTVRGVGFALETDVEQGEITVDAPISDAPPDSEAPSGPPVRADGDDPVADSSLEPADEVAAQAIASVPVPREPRGARLPRTMLIALAVLLVITVAWLMWPRASAPAPDIDDGYGFTLADLAPTHSDTPRLFAQSLAQDAIGDRSRAIALMQIAHETDAASPLPALMLALWAAGTIDQAGFREWMDQANARLDTRATPLVRLFRDYVEAAAALDSQRVVATAGALLGLRPYAWRMRHGRAHLLEYRGMRAAALDELREVEFPALGHRKRDLIIADIGSFGDPDAAERILARLADDPEQATWHFLKARLSWTREQWPEAAQHLRLSRELAHRQGRVDLQWRALSYEAVVFVILGRDAEATEAAERARTLMGTGNPIDELDMTILLAGLRAQRGQVDLATEEAQRLRGLLPTITQGDTQVSGWLLLLRHSLVGLDEGPAVQAGSPQEGLWRAARLAAASEEQAAREALAVAIERGIGSTRLWDDTRALQARLGLAVGPELPMDPPYGPLSRVLLRRTLASDAALTGPVNPS